MNKEFIPYEQALELKELGFDEPCLGYYKKNNPTLKFGEGFELITREYRRNVMHYPLKNSRYVAGSNAPDGYYYLTTSPTFSQAFRWFREKYGYFVVPQVEIQIDKIEVHFLIIKFGENRVRTKKFKTYEEAELECLKKLIEIVKEDK
jgi:hypothetical protein